MKEDFLDEIKLIIEIGKHPNILSVLGCCTVDEPYYLITEFMEYGDLLHFLWKCREVGRLGTFFVSISSVSRFRRRLCPGPAQLLKQFQTDVLRNC